MPKIFERILLFFSDLFATILAFMIWVGLRENFGYSSFLPFSELLFFSFLVYCYWFLFFLFFGLYRSWYAQSRFDEIISLLKTISMGVFLIFILTLDFSRDINNPITKSRIIFNFLEKLQRFFAISDNYSVSQTETTLQKFPLKCPQGNPAETYHA